MYKGILFTAYVGWKFKVLRINRRVYAVMSVVDHVEAMLWATLSYDLSKDPPDTGLLLTLIAEVRDRICDLTPHRPDLCAEIRENIDVDHMRQMFEHSVFDDSDLRNLVMYIVDRLKAYSPPTRDTHIDAWKTNLEQAIDNGVDICTFVPLFLRDVNKVIDDIEGAVRMVNMFIRNSK